MVTRTQSQSSTLLPEVPLEALDIPDLYAQRAKAFIRYKEADAAILKASVAGDIDAVQRAIFDREEALADLQKLKEHEAQQTLSGLRAVDQCYPDHPAAQLVERLANVEAILAQKVAVN